MRSVLRFVVVGASAVLIAACGGSVSGSGSAGTNGSSNNNNNNSSGSTGSLSSIENAAKAQANATFKATYNSTDSGGTTDTITLEQQPPKSLFQDKDNLWISDSTSSYICTPSSSSCVKTSSGGQVNPMVQAYSGTYWATIMQTWQTTLLLHIAGIDINYSSETFAGQSAQCADYKTSSDDTKICVTNAGVLAQVKSKDSNFELASYTSSVSSTDFNVPSGFTVTSM